MSQLSSLTDIARLYATRGGLSYGEGVTQMEHALQCAALAEANGGTPSLVAACLLHDIGHLFEKEDEVTGFAIDHRHEARGAKILSGFFDSAVWQPVALHVAAKRYLCFTEPGYFAALSSASQRSLTLQGGPFDAAQANSFEKADYWQDAVALRRFDDMGKRDEISLRSFDDFIPLLQYLLLDNAKA